MQMNDFAFYLRDHKYQDRIYIKLQIKNVISPLLPSASTYKTPQE